MKKLLAAVLALFITFPALASDNAKGGISIEAPWARATPGMAKAGAAYLTVVNDGDAPDRLIAARSDLAARTEIHNHLMLDGVMKMREVAAVEIAPGEPVVFRPGGLHVMFMGLKAPFREGQKLPLTLVFENAGEISFAFEVRKVGAKAPMTHQGHGQHKTH